VTYPAGTKLIIANHAELMCTAVGALCDVNNKQTGGSVTVLQLLNAPLFDMLISTLYYWN
jgi:hypothetical protein